MPEVQLAASAEPGDQSCTGSFATGRALTGWVRSFALQTCKADAEQQADALVAAEAEALRASRRCGALEAQLKSLLAEGEALKAAAEEAATKVCAAQVARDRATKEVSTLVLLSRCAVALPSADMNTAEHADDSFLLCSRPRSSTLSK